MPLCPGVGLEPRAPSTQRVEPPSTETTVWSPGRNRRERNDRHQFDNQSLSWVLVFGSGGRLELPTNGLAVRFRDMSRSGAVKEFRLNSLRRKVFSPSLVASGFQHFSTFRALSRPMRAPAPALHRLGSRAKTRGQPLLTSLQSVVAADPLGRGKLMVGDHPSREGAAVSGGIDPPIRPRSDEVSREQTRVDAASRRLIKPESFPVLTACTGDGSALGRPGVLSLRCERSAPIAVTGPNML
jgi:hypothetical protein